MQGVSSPAMCACRHRSENPHVDEKISFFTSIFWERGLMMIFWVFVGRPNPDGD